MYDLPEQQKIPGYLDDLFQGKEPPAEAGNPYLDVFRAVEGWRGWIQEDRSWIDSRFKLVESYSWAIPNEEALSKLAQFSPIVEIGAGGGYWAHLLRLRGVSVRAFDIPDGGYARTKTWTDIEVGGPEVLRAKELRRHTLFLCWPPYNGPLAHQCLMRFRGDVVIYVGEGSGGCTGDDAFHNELERQFYCAGVVEIPQWWGIHDRMFICVRRPIVYRTRQGVADLGRTEPAAWPRRGRPGQEL